MKTKYLQSNLNRVKEIPAIKTITFSGETIATYREIQKAVDSVSYVLIFSAASLAFIVLYYL